MEALNRDIPAWFQAAESCQLRLPRFQRYEAWGNNEVTSLLEMVLQGLPVGATLVLNVGAEEQFESRPISGITETVHRCTEQLLDGQQRLTALYKSLNDLYRDRIYLVTSENDEEHGGRNVPRVHGIARWGKNGKRYPLWVDDPKGVLERGYFPLRLLKPGDTRQEIQKWCDTAAEGDLYKSRDIENKISPLREKILNYNIPFLALPADTAPDTALDVFIKMNTSSVKLTAFDIIVARFEDSTGQSLHQLVQDLNVQVPSASAYQSPQDFILSAAAMREDRTPTQASFHRIDLQNLADNWSDLIAGIEWAVQILEEEAIFDEARLPTVAVLPVLVALHEYIPEALDARGRARTLIRSYIWRAFFTHRYDNSVSSRALQDLRGLSEVIKSGTMDKIAPIFDSEQYPLPSFEELIRAGWPRRKDTLARGILALSLKGGARDFADDERARRHHLAQREYHHLFPSHLLADDGKMSTDLTDRALNCALVSWNTNRAIAAKEPIQYLQERTRGTPLGESEVRMRLQSHLIPYDQLAVGGYHSTENLETKACKIKQDYLLFLNERAKLMQPVIEALCKGEVWANTQ
ncbi:MAG: DUF262 domain-containing protein [Caldilineaceae bacterium]|nr:DUF262 domain-containing protein [Caldilineaceae bacterium]